MADSARIRKVSEQIRRELFTIIPSEVYHAKASLVSVSGMELSRDFKFATVHVTIVGTDEAERDELVDLLNERAGAIRQALSKVMTTRTVPQLTFKYDESVEYGAKMDRLIASLNPAEDDE